MILCPAVAAIPDFRSTQKTHILWRTTQDTFQLCLLSDGFEIKYKNNCKIFLHRAYVNFSLWWWLSWISELTLKNNKLYGIIQSLYMYSLVLNKFKVLEKFFFIFPYGPILRLLWWWLFWIFDQYKKHTY
jgi:hypothetical protein